MKSEKEYCRYCGENVKHEELIALGICNGKQGKNCETVDTIYLCEEHYEQKDWRN